MRATELYQPVDGQNVPRHRRHEDDHKTMGVSFYIRGKFLEEDGLGDEQWFGRGFHADDVEHVSG